MEPVDQIEQRRAQQLQPGEGQLHFGLRATRSQHPKAGRLNPDVGQERGLTDTRITMHHQRPARTGPNLIQ
jgi:hypothetical protein